MAKSTRRASTPPSDSGSDSEIAASNIKTEPDEEEAARSQSFGMSSRAISSTDNDESEEDEDDEDEDEDEDEDDDVENSDEDNAPAPKRVPYKSAPAQQRTPFKSAPPKPAAPATKASTSSSSSSSSDDDPGSSSDSDSDGEDDKNASEKPAASKKLGKAAVNTNDSDSDSDSSDSESDSASSSDSDSNSDSNEAESEDAEARNVKTEEPVEPSVSEEADDTVVTAPEKADDSGDAVDSSDDDMEDIPNTLPPGTLPDVKADADSDADMVDAPAESSAELSPDSEQPELPQQPIVVQPAAASPAPGEAEQAPAPSRASRQRSKRQVAKRPFVSSQEPSAEAEVAPPASGDEAATSGEASAAPEEVPGTQEVTGTPDEAPATKPPQKRKRVAVDVPEEAAAEDPETPAPKSAKKRAAVRTPASRLSVATSAGGGSSSKKGPQGNFEPREVAQLEAAAARYMEENPMSQTDFNEMVHDNAQKHTAFWDFMSADFHNKKRMQIILRCRRIWHNYKQRYHWTEEEDAELAELVGKHGNKWLIIGAAMDRSSEDVRKRWVERVECGDKAIMSYWRFDEENRLGQVVGQVLREVQGSRNQDLSTLQPSAVRDIPWHIVSERMDHTRTARQCRTKWRLIRGAYHFNEDGDFVGPPRPDELSNSQIKAERAFAGLTTPAKRSRSKKTTNGDGDNNDTPASSRVSLSLLGITPEEDGRVVPETKRPINDRTRKQIKSMTSEEKHHLIQEIRKSNVGREDKIPWYKVGNEAFRKKYNRAARELIWSRLKRSVPDYNRKSIRKICDYLIKEFEANAAVGQAWDMDFDDPENYIATEASAAATDEEAAAVGSDSSAMPSSGAIVQAMAAAKSRKPLVTYGKRGTRAGAFTNGKVPKSSEFVAESDSDEAGGNGEPAEAEAAQPSKQPRARKGRATRVNGNAEKHVSESENEDALADQTNGTDKRRAARLANAAATRAKKAKALADVYADIEGASEPSNSQPNTQSQEDIEDADEDEDDTGRRARAASVDLSMGERLSENEAPEEGAGGGEMPLSLSPALARHKPTARSRPLNVSKQRRGDGPETNGTEQASRFLPPSDGGSASTSAKLTPQRPGEVRRTKKRSLNSAQWRADPGSGDEGDDGTNIADDIEEVGDNDRPRPAAASESLTSRAARAAMAFFPQKRARKE